MPRRSSDSFMRPVSWPSRVMVPEVGRIIRLIMRSEVVLPQPDGPTRTVICPLGASRLRLSTATVPSGYCFVTPSKTIMPINLAQPTDGRGGWQTPILGPVRDHVTLDGRTLDLTGLTAAALGATALIDPTALARAES